MDLGLDPVQRVADQSHALIGVKTLDGFHQAHIAFLDQVAVGQAVAQVLARHRHHQTQVREHQLAGGFEVVVGFELAGGLLLFLEGEHGHAVDRRNVSVEVAERGHHRPGVAQGYGRDGRTSLNVHTRTPFKVFRC